MSRKRTNYSAAFKSKWVLEVLKNEKTIAEIASANNITLRIFRTVRKFSKKNIRYDSIFQLTNESERPF